MLPQILNCELNNQKSLREIHYTYPRGLIETEIIYILYICSYKYNKNKLCCLNKFYG